MKKAMILVLSLCFVCTAGISVVKAEQSEHELMLESLGVLSAQGIYLTYTSIGTVVDGYSKKAYEKDFASELVQEFVNLSNVAKEQMNKLLGSKAIQGEDIDYLTKLVATYELLIAEGNAFKNYLKTDEEKHIKIYHEKREKAWKNISELLGLNK